MTFWNSELGELTGRAEDAFTKTFSIIPDGTMAKAKIERFTLTDNIYVIDWIITEGDFKGQHVFQKIKAFDQEPKRRHKSLNMLKYLFCLFDIKLTHSEPPNDQDLSKFVEKQAGIKIQEWSMPRTDGPGIMEGNYISEVHNVNGFKSETGVKLVPAIQPMESALQRNPKGYNDIEDDLPF
jgi:hypothetical protein